MTQSSVTPAHQPTATAELAPRTPVRCASMIDVRREIDRVDREIVTLIAERQSYIEQAGHIKATRDTVRDTPRVEDVVAKAKAKATSVGAHPDLIETVYRTMIEWCIRYEFTVFDAKTPPAPDTPGRS